MPDKVPFKTVLQSLYAVLLKRTPDDGELQPHIEELERGGSLTDLTKSIADSEEARSLRLAILADDLHKQSHGSVGKKLSVEIAADDLMNTIVQSYETFTGRSPVFLEVTEHLRNIANAAPLSGVIAAIEGSDEATHHGAGREIRSRPDSKDVFAQFIIVVYLACLKRGISEREIEIWYANYLAGSTYRNILVDIHNSEEARDKSSGTFEEWDYTTFVQLVYEIIMGRGAAPREIEHFRQALSNRSLSRQDILNTFFVHSARLSSKAVEPSGNDPTCAHLHGRPEQLTLTTWRERSEALKKTTPDETSIRSEPTFSRFLFTSKASPLVSVITSLFKGGRFIEPFLENIVSQTIFDQCELLIIDANSPESELQKAERFLKKYPNIKYKRFASRLGIYEAWNIGVKEAVGLYCTNANLDDCRRKDSFELQAATLDALPFVDVVYQNVVYSFTENMSFEDIARHGFSTDLPLVSRYNLLEFNAPHNGPMWRKRLHEDVGLFDASYRSAGDFDFWMRCVLAGKTFYKINDAHVAYYVNPQGLSTRSDTPGAAESDRITKTLNRRLISKNFTMDDEHFGDLLARDTAIPAKGESRYAMVQTALRQVSSTSRSTNAVRG